MNRLFRLGATIGGQVVWALAQAAIVLVLSHRGDHALIGIYTFGLAVFAPLCLVGSLNLRTTIALGQEASIAPRQALILRTVVVAAALAITLVVLAVASGSFTQWLATSLLVGIRAIDQLSDVTTGFFQRDNRQDLIARSFAIRGAANMVPFLALFLLARDPAVAAAGALLVTFGLTFWHDLAPMLVAGDGSNEVNWRGVLQLARRSALIAPYPVLDNLHFNSFRYAMFLGSSREFMGMIGVAQTLFVPFQILTAAMNLHYLPKVARLAEMSKARELQRQLIYGVVVGLLITGSFLLAACAMPKFAARLLFANHILEGVAAVKFVAIAMMPVAAVGFAASCQIARGRKRSYALAPLIGLATFGCLLLAPETRASHAITIAFLVSYVVRLTFTAYFAVKTHVGERHAVEPSHLDRG
jgi:O-antigen/teichoic acid export membrane protein